MKKLLVITLSLLMALTMFTACGGKQTSETDETVPTMSLKLSDNLPEFSMSGNYTENQSDIGADSETEVLWEYAGDDNAEYRFAAAYKWPAGDKSLMDASKEDALKFFPDQKPEVVTCNYWQEPDDYEYTYYAGVGEDIIYQVWTFQDGDYFYQISVGYDLVKYDVDDTDLQYEVPKQMKEIESEGALKAFIDPAFEENMSEFPNIETYILDEDFDFSSDNIAKAWGVENVKVEEHEYTGNDLKTKIPGYIVTCEYTEDGRTMVCSEHIIKSGDKYFGMCFSYNKELEFAEYIENSYRAFLYTIQGRS